jgi:hypothetical protein
MTRTSTSLEDTITPVRGYAYNKAYMNQSTKFSNFVVIDHEMIKFSGIWCRSELYTENAK